MAEFQFYDSTLPPFGTPEMSGRAIKTQMERNPIVREANDEVQHRNDPEGRFRDWSGCLRGCAFPGEGKKGLVWFRPPLSYYC